MREVRADCPPPAVIDLSFNEPLPECVTRFERFVVPDGITWGDLTAEQKAAIEQRNICLSQVQEWDAARQAARAGKGTPDV